MVYVKARVGSGASRSSVRRAYEALVDHGDAKKLLRGNKATGELTTKGYEHAENLSHETGWEKR